MNTDEALEQAAKDIVQGEADRTAAGGTPMLNPTAAEIDTQLTPYKTKLLAHSNALDAYDTAQEAVDALAPEADKVIKKVYDEAETHFNEEEPESQRANCREWGVLYVVVGEPTQLTVLLRTKADAPVAGAGIKLVEAAGKTLITNAEGRVVFDTRVVGEAGLEVYLNPAATTPDLVQPVLIDEGVPQTLTVKLEA